MANLIRALTTLFPTPDAKPGVFDYILGTLLNRGLPALASHPDIEAIGADRSIRYRSDDGTVTVHFTGSEWFPDFVGDDVFGPTNQTELTPGFAGVPQSGPAVSVISVSKWSPPYRWFTAVAAKYYGDGIRMYTTAIDISDTDGWIALPTVLIYTVDEPISDGSHVAVVKLPGIADLEDEVA